jgi:hypothetical protein
MPGGLSDYSDQVAQHMPVRLALENVGLDSALQVIEYGGQAIAFLESLDKTSSAPPLDPLLLAMNLPKRGGEDILKCLHYFRKPMDKELPETPAKERGTA